MSEHEMQTVIDGVVTATLKSKKQWDIAKISSVFIAAGTMIFALGIWNGNLSAWRQDIQNWREQTTIKLEKHDEDISRLQGTQHVNRVEYNSTIQPKNFANQK